jgi:hypothetical protein
MPAAFQPHFEALYDRLRRLFQGNLIGFSVYGGWLHKDPFLEGELATSVATLERDQLEGLSNIALEGMEYAGKGVRAPYLMSREYLKSSRDTFPLEVMEIQQTGSLVGGEDLFGPLELDRRFVRLQCERGLKSEQMYLRQSLLRHDADSAMKAIFRPCALRLLPTLRGLLHLHGRAPNGQDALSLVRQTAATTHVKLEFIEKFVHNPPGRVSQGYYTELYEEVGKLAAHVDGLPQQESASPAA